MSAPSWWNQRHRARIGHFGSCATTSSSNTVLRAEIWQAAFLK
ncbi:hypothetical protein [Streptomyces cinerochromogenes]|nr:hypothetical protein [Streptomyces cinerochromogenes]